MSTANTLIFSSMVRMCTTCGQEKSLDAFAKASKVKRDGRNSRCRGCRKIYQHEYRSRPGVKEREAEYHARLYEEPGYRQQMRENQHKPQNRMRKTKYGAKYRKENKENIREWAADYIRRPHAIKLRRENNRRFGKTEGRRKWEWDRRKEPKWNLHYRISSRVRRTLRNGSKAGKSWKSILDFSVEDLIQHLEEQFDSGMSWDNMDKWHIDHILPVASFNFDSPDDEDFKECWALSNLQPLWAEENLAKGTKILSEHERRVIA